MKYRTKIEITADANNKDEAMEIVGEYLSGNIASGIEMEYATKPVRFYNHSCVKLAAIILLVMVGFISGARTSADYGFAGSDCRVAAVQPPLKTSAAEKSDASFKREWHEKQTKQALEIIRE